MKPTCAKDSFAESGMRRLAAYDSGRMRPVKRGTSRPPWACPPVRRRIRTLQPLVEPAQPVQPAGQDTTSAVRSGVYWSCAGGVLALIERFKELPGCEGAAVVCTGSDASLLLPVLPESDSCAEPDLLFKGMAIALGLQP